MYSRSNSVTVAVQRERFAAVSTRSTEPEVFTFERIATQATAVRSTVPIRPRKRATRVMYPAKVRMHLPPPEKMSQAKRWLVVLCLVVLWQIYTEEPEGTTALNTALTESLSSCQTPGFTFKSPEEELTALSHQSSTTCELQSEGATTSSTAAAHAAGEPTDSGRSYEQSAGKSCVVALLVYHRLNSDN